MSWFALKKAKTIVYIPNEEYGKFVNQYADMNRWDASDKISFYISGSKRNKEKKRITDFILDSMTNEWEHNKKGFREKYSFIYHADAIEKHLYELIWSFCEFNPHYQMMISSNGIVTLPRVVDINLSVTFGKDFYVGECYGMRKRIAASQYRIQTDSVRLISGDMMDFRIGFNNGAEYRFQTIYDGRKTSGSISTDVGDLSKWKTLLEKTEEERLECEKANAPSRIISTDEFQRTTLGFAQDACELYEEIPDIDQDYEHYAMTPNVFVDFSVYERRWIELHDRAKAKYDEILAFDLLWGKQPNRDFNATGLFGVMMNQTMNMCTSLHLYCSDMAQMMHHLFEKAQGGKYSMKQYQEELKQTELRRNIVDHEYPDVKKRLRDQTKRYNEQM